MPLHPVQVVRELIYSHPPTGVDAENTLDLYTPTAAPPDTAVPLARPPLLVFVHGGVWRTGDKAEHADLGQALSSQYGIAVAVVNYRLSHRPDEGSPAARVLMPAHVQDVARAVGFLLASGRAFGYDARRVYLSGHSAGAHIVALLTLQPGRYLRPALAETGGLPTTASPAADPHHDAVRGTCGSAGLYDLPRLVRTWPSYREFFDQAFPSPQEETLAVYSPQLVEPTATPVRPWLILHSAEDELVDEVQSAGFAARLKELNYPVTQYFDLHGAHDEMVSRPEYFQRLADFVQSHP
ncbi:hypothetical protein IWQ60_002700 [Tieghemiomyces parasiticus]|uniref:BD-FAE-like domain-containing protein n=1 Tax=Tieghemiomyces parasiticus TaxID=78921 RepID=A0A9W8AAW3_9FUNG|nr:hypothetical protein IWQ60_002700 [Tieghemiomyces parasiticus]